MYYKLRILFTILCTTLTISGFSQSKKSFKIVPLGVLGGIDESNLSAYMVAAAGTDNYICMDAGTLYYGIKKAIDNKVFNVPAQQVLKNYIKGYFISHAHLDHLSGLIINSPDDNAKSIYALASCIETIKTHYFTWQSWANFANEGGAPQLKKYTYHTLSPGIETIAENTALTVKAFPLSHSNLESTAFLIRNNNDYLLYLGDTGADEIEKSHNLHTLWQNIAPLIKSKRLKGMMIEVSFPDKVPDNALFGHLTPKWLMAEMDDLSKLTGKEALKNFNLVITHTKPPLVNIVKIKTELAGKNKLGFNIIFPAQGKMLSL